MMHWLARVQLKLLLISCHQQYKPTNVLANLFSFYVTPLVVTIVFIDFEHELVISICQTTNAPHLEDYHLLSDYVYYGVNCSYVTTLPIGMFQCLFFIESSDSLHRSVFTEWQNGTYTDVCKRARLGGLHANFMCLTFCN